MIMKTMVILMVSVLLTQCTRDLQPNPYTTVIKYIMKGKNENRYDTEYEKK